MPGADLTRAQELTELAKRVHGRRACLAYSRDALAAARKQAIDNPSELALERWRFCYQREQNVIKELSLAVADYNEKAQDFGVATLPENAKGERPRRGRPRKWASLPQAYLARQAFQKERDDQFRVWRWFEMEVFVLKLTTKVDEENAVAIYESHDCRLRKYAEELLDPTGDNHSWSKECFEQARLAGEALQGYLKAKADLVSVRRAIIKLKAEQKAVWEAEYQRERARNLAYIANKQKANLPPAVEKSCADPGRV